MLVCSNKYFLGSKLSPSFKTANVLAVSPMPETTSPTTPSDTHAGQIRDTDMIHLRDNAPPAIGAAKIIGSRNLSVRKKRDALEVKKREKKRVSTLAYKRGKVLWCVIKYYEMK